jgi:hypothetical protein
MAKKSLKKTTKRLAPDVGGKQADSAYPAEAHELKGQRQRLKTAAAAGAEALESPKAAATPGLHPALGAPASRPLTPLAALWPTPPPSPGASGPSEAPARKVKTMATKAAAVQVSPAPAPQPAKLPIQWHGAPAVVEAPAPPGPSKVKVTFVLPRADAEHVSLSGEFNGWSPGATPMKRCEDGHWEAVVELEPGRYQYKFIVDGQWICDPRARENVWNQHGTQNSVVEVRA